MAERPSDRDIVDRHLKRAWTAVAPAPALQAQVRARLTASSAATMGAVSLGMAANARPMGGWASLQASGKLGALVGLALLGLGLVSGYVIRDSQEPNAPALPTPQLDSASVTPPLAPEPEAVDVAATDAPVIARPESPTPAPAARAARPMRTPVAPPALDLGAPSESVASAEPSGELSLLRRAERAVRAESSALALALIAELEAKYPASKLLEERRALELLAYCGVDATDAPRRARRFLQEHPGSVYAGRIRERCPVPSELSPLAPR